MGFFASPAATRAIDASIGLSVIVPVVYLAFQYGDMPERIPVHWNIRGEVDRWATRGLISVFFPAVLAILLQSLFGMLIHDLLSALERVRETVGGSQLRADALAANLGMMQAMRIVLAALLTLVVLSLPLTTSSPRSPAWWPYAIGGSVVAMMLVVIIGVIRLWIAQERWEAAVSSSAPEFREENWRWGGSIYFNPADDELIILKRMGPGFTMNFAHPRAKRYAALFVFMFVFVLVAVTTSI